jgi:large subunit ribosomal protein L21
MKTAIVEINKNQYLVKEGAETEVKKIGGIEGEKADSDKVLLVIDGDKVDVGQPYIEKAKVSFEILKQYKGEKVRTLTYKAKARQRKRHGARPEFTLIKIVSIKN